MYAQGCLGLWLSSLLTASGVLKRVGPRLSPLFNPHRHGTANTNLSTNVKSYRNSATLLIQELQQLKSRARSKPRSWATEEPPDRLKAPVKATT